MRHISNGLIENRNKIIKEIKYSANGYKNFERFRARILYSINNTIDTLLTLIQLWSIINAPKGKKIISAICVMNRGNTTRENEALKRRWGHSTPTSYS